MKLSLSELLAELLPIMREEHDAGDGHFSTDQIKRVEAALSASSTEPGRAYYEAHPMYDGGVVVPWDELPEHLKADAAASGTEPTCDCPQTVTRCTDGNRCAVCGKSRLPAAESVDVVALRERIARAIHAEYCPESSCTRGGVEPSDYRKADAVLAALEVKA